MSNLNLRDEMLGAIADNYSATFIDETRDVSESAREFSRASFAYEAQKAWDEQRSQPPIDTASRVAAQLLPIVMHSVFGGITAHEEGKDIIEGPTANAYPYIIKDIYKVNTLKKRYKDII